MQMHIAFLNGVNEVHEHGMGGRLAVCAEVDRLGPHLGKITNDADDLLTGSVGRMRLSYL